MLMKGKPNDLPQVAIDLKRQYKHGKINKILAVIDTGSTHSTVNKDVLDILQQNSTASCIENDVELNGVNGVSHSNKSISCTGFYHLSSRCRRILDSSLRSETRYRSLSRVGGG